jgi:hypothetical protein
MANITRENFIRLAQLFGIRIKKRWVTDLAKRLQTSQPELSSYMSRNKIPPDRLIEFEQISFPLSKWYFDPKKIHENSQTVDNISDKSGLWGKTREVSANGKVVKLTLYEAEKQHDEPQVAISTDLAPLVYRLEKALVGQKEDIAMLIKVLDKADDAEIMRSVARILTSGETSTAMALKMNVMEFGEKIEKEKKLKGTIYGMEQQIIATNAEVAKLKAELSKEKKGPPGLREPVDPAQHE